MSHLHSLFNFQIFFFLNIFFLDPQFTIVNKILLFQIKIMIGLNAYYVTKIVKITLKTKFTLIFNSLTFSCASCMMKLTICFICLLESADIALVVSYKRVRQKNNDFADVIAYSFY